MLRGLEEVEQELKGLSVRALSDSFENNYPTEMCSGSEAGSYLGLIDLVYHSTIGLRVKTKKGDGWRG